MRAVGALAGVLTIISATLGIVMNLRRDRQYRRAFAAGEAHGGRPYESRGTRVLRVGAWVAFIVLALSGAALFLTSVIGNVGSF